jgi:hypothetical protein
MEGESKLRPEEWSGRNLGKERRREASRQKYHICEDPELRKYG